MSIKKGYKVIAGAPLEPVWGNISGDITDQADLLGLFETKADANSATLTGTPTAPTPPEGSDDDRIATTAFLHRELERIEALPSQTGHGGQYLTTDGTIASWVDVDALPSQEGQSGKFLTTNGTDASWSTVDLSGKVDKTTDAYKVYGTNNSGSQITYAISSSADATSIAYRSTGGVLSVGTPTVDSHATTKKYVDDGLSAKLDKITYEWNKAISFGSTGSLCIGKFCCYDSNITVDIDATTSTTYHGTLVIATQNIGTAGGGLLVSKVYGDATNTITPNIHIYKHPTGDCMIEVYFTPLPWSKNLIHIRAITLNKDHGSVSYDSVYSDICTNVESVPAEATIIPDNALDSKQTTLVSGTNIKTINNTTILGSGNIDTHELPSQSGNNGKFLTTNGSSVSWESVDALPTQAGNANKFLTTDGTNASWATVDALPSQTSQSGKFLTTNGTTASWASLPTYSSGTGITVTGTTINHSNSVTAGTAGTSSATSGSTLAVPYITYDAQGHITASGTHTHTVTGFLTQNDVTSTYSDTGTAPLNGQAVKSAIDSAISSVYKPAGSVAFANRPSLSKTIEGNVYNITDNFTTTTDFVEGAGKSYPAGTNIVCINTATSGTAVYKWDVLAGMVDLSNYQTLITSTNKLNADLVDDSSSTNKFVTSSEKTSWNNKVDITGDTMTGNLQIQGAGLYLTSIGSSVAESTSRLNLGTPGNVYSYLTGNSQGAFGIYSEKSGTRTGIACYPGQNFFADATTKTMDLGRSNNVWKIGYIDTLSNGSSSISLSDLIAKQDAITDLATIRSGAAAGATALQPNTAITSATKCKITYDAHGLVTAGADLTASDIPSITLSKISDVTATATELNYVDGVTSNIQTQLNNKATDSAVVHLAGDETITGTKSFESTLQLKNNLSFRSYGTNDSGRLQFRAQPSDNVIRGTVAITDGYSTSGSGYTGFVAQMVAREGSTTSEPFNTMRVSNKGIEYIKETNDGTITGQYILIGSDGIVPQARLASGGTNGQVLMTNGTTASWTTISADVQAYTAAEVQTIWDSVVPNS